MWCGLQSWPGDGDRLGNSKKVRDQPDDYSCLGLKTFLHPEPIDLRPTRLPRWAGSLLPGALAVAPSHRTSHEPEPAKASAGAVAPGEEASLWSSPGSLVPVAGGLGWAPIE